MREIKFRAWDKVNKRMGFFDGLEWDDEYCEWYLREVEKPTICDVPPGENVEVMQYTGLNDKNGREIYEGDVIADTGETLGKVVFEDGGFCILTKQGKVEPLWIFDHEPEVIGNIYENPELLK